MNTHNQPIAASALAAGLVVITTLAFGAYLLNVISITQPALF